MSGGGWHHDGVFEVKQCGVCKRFFKPKSGSHKFCSEQCKDKWKYISGVETTDSQYRKISNNWPRYFSRLINTHRRMSALSRNDLLEIYTRQKGLCALTGVELTCILKRGERAWTNASVDRKEAGGSYLPSNVQLVCVAVNIMHNQLSLAEYISWCKKVAEYDERT